jgi:hypothetical protein
VKPYILALIAHGMIGGADVLFNHELIAKLPSRAGAAREQLLHSARELLFGLLFGELAWYEWHGWAAYLIAGVVLLELLVSTVDTVLEWDTRVLPVTERVMHVLLFVNSGIIVVLLGQALMQWRLLSIGLAHVEYGVASYILLALSSLALGWSARDLLAARQAHLQLP